MHMYGLHACSTIYFPSLSKENLFTKLHTVYLKTAHTHMHSHSLSTDHQLLHEVTCGDVWTSKQSSHHEYVLLHQTVENWLHWRREMDKEAKSEEAKVAPSPCPPQYVPLVSCSSRLQN